MLAVAGRGILLYGEPGTGKTLVARALAGACARSSPRPVTFFARKGADCLGKFSGEAERTLRLMFEEARLRFCPKGQQQRRVTDIESCSRRPQANCI